MIILTPIYQLKIRKQAIFYTLQFIMKKVSLTLFQSLFSASLDISSHQNNDNANEYFHSIQRFIKQRSLEFQQLLNDSYQTKCLYDKLAGFKKVAVAFFTDYGALIVVTREEQFSPLDISIVFVTEWGLTTYIKKETILYLPDKPLTTENIYVGRAKFYDDIQFFCQDLAKEMRKIMKEQQQYRQKKYKNNERKNHHTPSYLLQITKVSLSNLNDQHFEAIKNKSQQAQKIEVKQVDLKEVLSKGGTLDVGIHTGITSPNTTLSLVLACFQYLLQSKDLVEIIHLQLKLYQLKEKVIDFRQFQYSKFLSLQRCLKELCYYFKQLSIKQISFNQGHVKDEIRNINQRLQSVFRPNRMNQIEPQQLCNHLQTLKYKNQLTFSDLQKYDIDNEFILVKNGSLGISRSFAYINTFRKLLDCKNHYTLGIWMITVQNFFFQKAINCLAPGKRLTVPLEEVRCNSETQLSVIHKIIIEYQRALKGKDQAKEYGMKLSNQTYSHYYLIRYIGAAIVFQTVKQSRKTKKSNLDDYRVPSNIDWLSQHFTSLSSIARRALKVMVTYQDINSRKEPIFVLGESHKSIMKLVEKLAIEQIPIKNWIDQKQKKMNNQINMLTSDLVKFKDRYASSIQKIQNIQQQQCNCRWQTRYVKKKQRSVKIQCNPCQAKSTYQRNLASNEKQTKNYIIAPFSKHQKSFYGFLHNIPLQILGLMKIIYETQINPSEDVKQNPQQKNFIAKNYSQFFIWSEDIKKSTFLCYLNYDKHYQDLIKYPPSDVYFYYRGNKTAVPISLQLLSPQVYEGNLFGKSHQFMINYSPFSNKNREHEIYSKLNLSHKKSNQSLEDFINYGSIRVTSITQIPLLCQMIRQRTIRLNFLIENNQLLKQEDKHLFVKALIVLNTVGHVQSFDIPDENVRHEHLMNSCITDLLKRYLDKWKYDDLYCLHLTGAIFSLLSKLTNKDESLLPIIHKIFQEYEKLAAQVKTHDNTSKSQLAFFLHGAMSFFCQDITYRMNQELIHLWTKIHFLYRIKKVFSDQNIADQRYRQTLIFFQNFRERAIFNNIQNVSNYFKKRPRELLAIIKKIDVDIDDQTVFIHSPQKGDYTYTGTSAKDKIYQINLFTGVLLKNGVELAGLPDIIKKNSRYESIFGQNRDLQVYPQIDGSLRTRNNFDIYFKNEKNAIILFQFKIMKKDMIIRMIIKRNNTQIKYVLIPDIQLDKSNFEIPILYRDKYFAWYCSEEKVIVFRQKSIDHIKNISLVMLLDKKQGKNKKIALNSARIVENNFKLESVQYLKNTQNQQLFNLLKFKMKTVKFQQIYANKILSSLQDPRYILQISSPSRTTKGKKGPRLIKFILHRYNLTFTLVDNKYLHSDNYQGYAVSQNYDDNKFLPWSQIDKVKCLVLEKIDRDLRFARNHQFMVLVPDNNVSFQGPKNPISLNLMNIEAEGQDLQMRQLFRIFSYEIHDHFHDLRGKNRLQTLHLAALIGSCWKSNKLSIMTNQQYAISLLRSCYSTKPLSPQQFKKLQNILKNAIQLNQHTIILVCQVVYFLSNILESILPFGVVKNKNKEKQVQPKIENLFVKHQELIGHCKYHYQNLIANQNISVRSQLSQIEKKILGIKISHYSTVKNQQRSQRQMKSNLSLITSKKIQDDFNSWEEILIKVYNLKKQLFGAIPQKRDQNIKLELNLQVNCQMSKEQQQEIKSSLISFNRNNQKLDLIDLKNLKSKDLIEQYMLMEQILQQICQKILINIAMMQEQVFHSIEFYTYRNYPIKQHQFTKILCEDNYLSLLFPRSQASSRQILKKLISLWMKIKIELDSINRVETILQDEHLDKVTFLREIQSPREKITQNIPWICFQMEMKTQIWLSQYETFKLLSQNRSGIVTQLNMGEGKTQVIIPMIVLNQIYIKKDKIPRVNLLTPLYHEAQANYYKFLSVTGFKLPLFPIYFNRDVVMSPTHIKQIQYAVNLLHKHCLILVDRDSILSIILKIRQQNCRIKKQDNRQFSIYKSCKKDQWFFRDIKILDIFDEVDALMTAKKSFIYSIGNSSSLPHNRMRFEYCTIILEVILKELIPYMLEKDIIVLQQSYENAYQKIAMGHYPKGLRIMNNTPSSKIKQLRSKIFMLLMNKYLPPQFQFYKSFNQQEKQALKTYCIDQSSNSSIISDFIEDNLRNQIYIVRGLLAYGVIEHCLSLRCGVDYGVPGVNSIKKVGVPYQAADVPSKRSEYSHPQVATILSYLSYYNRGLTVKQFQQALKCLISQTKSSQHRNYRQWTNCIQKQQCRPVSAKQANQINYQSAIQRQQLYSCFQFNRATINFWLTHCVFPTDLTQYTKSITSSSWDLAKSQNCIGFSGTKDTHWVFPQYLYLKNCGNDEINGTDGKMIQLMLQNTIDVKQIKTSSDDLWMRFCQSSLQLGVGCIIDAGAILAGKQLQLQIVPWISNHPLFKKLNYKGISYCSQDGIWRVYDTTTNSIIPRDSNIPQHETFVIFDEARTRGADMKMKMNTVASLSLGPNMAKDKLMQAVGRLRKFGRNQKIYILSSQQILTNINGLLKVGKNNKKAKTTKVLQWVCSNSIRDNKKMLYPNSKLAWIHFQNIYSKNQVSIQQSDPSLSKMYEQQIQEKQLIKVHEEMSENFIQKYGVQQLLIYIHQNINKYGHNYAVKCHSYDDICQRQTQMVQQALKEAENEHAALIALNESDFSEISDHSLTSIDIQLDQRLTFTRNFLSCTDSKEDIKYKQDNELCKIHYVMIQPKLRQMRVLTQRQVYRYLTEGVMFIGPDGLNKPHAEDFIVRFEDLSIHQTCIQKLSLERALTDAHFFNGAENFQNRNYIYDTILHNKNRLRNYPVDRIICHFLQRRRTIEQKYMCSHLQGIFKQMISSR